jgi:hypothetical protein
MSSSTEEETEPLQSSLEELSRRSDSLLKNLDELKQLALSSLVFEKDSSPNRYANHNRNDALSQPGIVLKSLTEFNIRNLCGAAVYGAGLQEYIRGKVSRSTFCKNTLSGKVDEGRVKNVASKGNPEMLLPTITLERSSTRPRISGSCGCTLAQDGSVCPHMAALMIAWVRKPHEFKVQEDYQIIRSGFDEAKQRAEDSLRELTRSVANGSSRARDLQMLRRTHSKLKLLAREVKGARDNEQGDLVGEFLGVLNLVSFHLMYAIDRKYRDGNVVDLYNGAMFSAFGKAIESFSENTVSSGSTGATIESAKKRKPKKSSLTATKSTNPARSWDGVVERFFSSSA